MNKENSSRKANVVVRSPYKTRSYTTKNGISVEQKKTRATATKKVKEVKVVKEVKAVKEVKEEPIKQSTKQKPSTKQTTKVEKSSSSKSTTKTSIATLDHNTLEIIFGHVGAYDTIWNVSRVCRKWNEISKKVPIWV